MINSSILLKHYKRNDIQETMVDAAKNREISSRFGENGFGKRPDVLTYPNDVLELVKQGTTSFHVSEEHWSNPLALSPTLKKEELEKLRIGWDLVLDIDCKYWEYAKIIAHLLVKELKAHGITSISVKFSGSKGFHIGVPFEAFPEFVQGKETKLLFPEAPKRISLYLKDRIEPALVEFMTKKKTVDELKKELNKETMYKYLCKKCGNEQKMPEQHEIIYVCPQCQKKLSEEKELSFKLCPDCATVDMVKLNVSEQCKKCGNKRFEKKFDLSDVLEIDTILISSRHLYRMPYSLHEKTSLCSIPINPETILKFEKLDALPSKVTADTIKEIVFLDTRNTNKGEASQLLFNAYEYKPVLSHEEDYSELLKKEFDIPEYAIPVELFPPCMIKGLSGIKDGKKRFMFALINFLDKVGWSLEQIEELLFQWNEKNLEVSNEQLREVIIRGQLSHRKLTKKSMLPPNCMSYYQDLGICNPDRLCSKIKNPVQYASRKAFIINREENSGRQKLTDEQKKMRKNFREKLKISRE